MKLKTVYVLANENDSVEKMLGFYQYESPEKAREAGRLWVQSYHVPLEVYKITMTAELVKGGWLK